MANLGKIFSKLQFRVQRSKLGTKIVVIVALVLSMTALIALRLSMNDLQARTEKLRNRAVSLEQANIDLQEHIDNLGSVQSVVEIAEEELGLVQPGTIVFQPES